MRKNSVCYNKIKLSQQKLFSDSYLNFFKVLFISVLIGFIIFLFKIIIFNFTGKSNINFIYSYLVILILPLLLGLYQVVTIERN